MGVNHGPRSKYHQYQNRRHRFRSRLSLNLLLQPTGGPCSCHRCQRRRWPASSSIAIRRSHPARRPLRTAFSSAVLIVAGYRQRCRPRRRTLASAGADCLKSPKSGRHTASNCKHPISPRQACVQRESPPHESTPLQNQVGVPLKDDVHRGPSRAVQALVLGGVGGSPSGEPRGIVFRSRSIFFIAVMWENEPRRGGEPRDPLLGTADDRAATPGRLELRLPCPDDRPRRRHGQKI